MFRFDFPFIQAVPDVNLWRITGFLHSSTVTETASGSSRAIRLSETTIVPYLGLLALDGINIDMKRREFIISLGAGVLSTGCLSDSDATDPDTTTTDYSAIEMCATGTDALDGFSIGESTDSINPHGLTVQNDGDTPRTVTLRIIDTEFDKTYLNQSCSLDSGEAVSGKLRGTTEYRVTVTLHKTGMAHNTNVAYFDTCNDYETTVTLSPEGTITSETMRTEIECDPEK